MDDYRSGKSSKERMKYFKKKGLLKDKIAKVMHEYKHDELHSGSKSGPLVKDRKQALAIGFSEARKAKQRALDKKKD